MKSLELFFFVPLLLYFLWQKFDQLNGRIQVWRWAFSYTVVIWTIFIVLTIDTVFFVVLNIYFILSNQRKRAKF
jgi:hypothetical protein